MLDLENDTMYNYTYFKREKLMTEQQKEILLITSEEAAEVIQAISKIFRFGIDAEWKGIVNRKHLAEELGDLQCMIDLCRITGIVSEEDINNAAEAKYKKLQQWSTIFK